MTMQPYPRNPIEQRKAAVRKYSRNGALAVASGLLGGVALWVLLDPVFLVLGLIVAVVGGFVNYRRVQRIVNHRDEY